MLDFSKNNKKFLPIKLRDGKLLNVYVPTLRMLGELSTADLNNIEVDAITELMAKILSNNMQRAIVSKEQVEELTMDEIIELIKAIVEFTTEVSNAKN